jgi:DNA-binding XRE family transcriptional regulator
MNQNELGEKANIGRASISNIEKGRQKPPLSVIYKICHELDVDVHSILPTYIEIDNELKIENESSFKSLFDYYDLDENTQKEIDDLFKDL